MRLTVPRRWGFSLPSQNLPSVFLGTEHFHHFEQTNKLNCFHFVRAVSKAVAVCSKWGGKKPPHSQRKPQFSSKKNVIFHFHGRTVDLHRTCRAGAVPRTVIPFEMFPHSVPLDLVAEVSLGSGFCGFLWSPGGHTQKKIDEKIVPSHPVPLCVTNIDGFVARWNILFQLIRSTQQL